MQKEAANMQHCMDTTNGGPNAAGSWLPVGSELADKWGDEKEPVKEGVTFYLKQVGSALVEELTEEGASYGDSISAAAVHTIVNMAKLNGKKKLPKMALTVSTRGIRVVDMADDVIKQDVTIYRISFCTADKTHDKIFAYVARNTENETMECHAFLCPKRKIAQAVTLTVAQAFAVAQEEWLDKQAKEEQNKITRARFVQTNTEKKDSPQMNGRVLTNGMQPHKPRSSDTPAGLINFDDNFVPTVPPRQSINKDLLESELNFANTAPASAQLAFDDNFVEEDDEFSSLAQSRSGHAPLTIGPSPGPLPAPLQAPAPAPPAVRPTGQPFANPFHNCQLQTSLRAEDLDEGVEEMLNGQPNPYHMTRQPSLDDLLCL